MDSNIKRQIILEHYNDPINRGLIDEEGYLSVNSNSESCIDNLDFMMKVEEGIIKDIRFDGEACAVSTSATSIMISILIGKSVEEAKLILTNYQNMVNEEEYDEKLLGELVVYDEVGKQPNRKNCVLLPGNAVLHMIQCLEKSND